MRRVVITGLGAVTPLGIGKDTFWNAIREGVCGIDRIEKFDTADLACKIAAEVKDFEPEAFLDRKEAKRMDRYTQFAMAATKLALEDGNVDLSQFDPDRIGVIIGSGIGGIETFENQCRVFLEKGPGRVSPFFIPMMIANMASGQVAIMTGAKGPNYAVVSACSSGNHAIGESFRAIQRGDADAMITGGAEAAVTPLTIAGFSSMKAMSTNNDDPKHASRPFDLERDGFILGEGAGILILEELEHAKKRGATVYAELVGYGATDDAFHMTAPHSEGEGAARAMRLAIEDAGISPADVGYINAHGTSTPLNDALETKAVKSVFGAHAYELAVSSTKSMTGHLLGAAGAVEAIVCTMALRDGFLPPTINHKTIDPECDLDYVTDGGRKREITYALSNSLGFGGHNSSLCFKKYE